MSQPHRFATRAIHAGQEPDPTTGAVVVPVYLTSTYAQVAPGVHKGYEYSRTDNPTRRALEEALAALEEAAYGIAFASGLAAETTVLLALRPGDHVLAGDDLYGGTYRLFERVFRPYGLEFSYVDFSRPDWTDAFRETTRLVWLETPTNPLLKVFDIGAVAREAHARGAQLLVDNTFASPYLQQPLTLGADLVLHSTTKYLGGHSDVVGGVVLTSDPDWNERLRFLQNAVGAVPGPMDCWLVLRGIKTLAARMEAHCRNAERVVDFLLDHPRVTRVYYPGLPDHPGHEAARRQMKGFGGMVSFEVEGGAEAAARVASRTRIFILAESLGGVESLIEVPAVMTHASVAGSELAVPAGLIRLSVGIEDPEDLIADLAQALEA